MVEAGLPVHTHTRGTQDITGQVTLTGVEGVNGSGVFYSDGSSYGRNGGHENYTMTNKVGFDASRSWTGNTSNPIYTNNIQNSSTVQPQTIKCFVYIVIATSSKTEIQTDIDEIATDLNGKADNDLSNLNTTGQAIINSKANTDLSNITDTGYIKMAGASMPSNTQITLTLGADGATYTAPADGWVIVTGYNANSSITIWQGSTNMSNTAGNSGDYYTVMIPVRKGNFNVGYRGITLVSFKFIYAQGSESEAS